MGTMHEEHRGDGAAVAGEVLDELVPPPWSTRRRLVVGLVASALVAILGVLWWAGVLTPNLAAQPWLGGTSQVGTSEDEAVVERSVTILVPIENRGWVRATIHDWRPPATDGIAWADAADPLPVTLEPGESVEIEFHAEVASCREVNARGTDGLDLVTQGPLGLRTTSSVDLQSLATIPSWPTGHDDLHLADPDRHEPSWLYHVLGWDCDPAAVDLDERR